MIDRKVRISRNAFMENDIEGKIKAEGNHSILVELNHPINGSINYLVVTTRYAEDKMADLTRFGKMLCNVTATSDDRANSNTPFDLTWWRGGNATITDVILLP